VDVSIQCGPGSGWLRAGITGEEKRKLGLETASHRWEYGRDIFAAMWSMGVGGGSGLM